MSRDTAAPSAGHPAPAVAAIGRAAPANPDFVEKIRTGRDRELIPYDEDAHRLMLH